jgi:hypothetical protein
MKVLASLLGGALVVSEQGGVVSLTINESIGQGKAAGVVMGSASVQLNALALITLGESALNAALPAALMPLVSVIESVANQALRAIE